MSKRHLTLLCATFLGSFASLALEPGKDVELQKEPHKANAATQLYISFDQALGHKFENLKNKKCPAVIKGDVKSVDGIFGKAVQTPEKTSVSIPQKTRVTRAIIIELWLKPGKEKKDIVLLETKGEKKNRGWKLELLSAKEKGKLKWTAWHPNGTQSELIANRGLSENKWSKVTLTYGGVPGTGGTKGYRIYIDGYIAAELPSYSPLQDVTGNLIVKTPPDGALDDLSISLSGREVYPKIADKRLEPFNLDFEQKDKGWIGVYDSCFIDDETKHSGKHSLKIETDDLYTREYLSPIFSVEPGTTYRISFWAKVDKFKKGYSAIGVWIRWYFAPEETCSFGGDLVAHCVGDKKFETFDWKKFEAEIKVPEKKEYREKIRWARLQAKNYHSITKAWIDDIKIEKITQAKNTDKGDK